jgi:cytochrome c-type biogenesis protein CcmH/NrfG
MTARFDLINQGDKPNWFEVCELYREMGKFYEAQQALDLAKELEPRLAEMMNALIYKKNNCPVRYKL